jgi:hypothetical protein
MHPSADETVNETALSDAPASRALVVIAPPPHASAARPHRNAQFVAQLIATRTQAPQTRIRRRAEPREAADAYRAVASLI